MSTVRYDLDRLGRSPEPSAASSSSAQPLRVLVVDDHRLFLDGMRSLLQQWRPDAQIDEAGRLADALHELGRRPPFHLILLDLMLPDSLEPSQTLAQVVGAAQGAPVVALSMHDQAPVVADAVRAGARGFIRKSDGASVMLAALEMVLAGGSCVPADATQPVADRESNPHLSERQKEVLALIVRGLSNKEIARALNIAEPTVKVHVHRILQSIGTSSRAKAAAWAREAGLGGPVSLRR